MIVWPDAAQQSAAARAVGVARGYGWWLWCQLGSVVGWGSLIGHQCLDLLEVVMSSFPAALRDWSANIGSSAAHALARLFIHWHVDTQKLLCCFVLYAPRLVAGYVCMQIAVGFVAAAGMLAASV